MATLATLEPLAELAGHSDRAWHVSWRFDGKLLGSCSGDKTIRLWAANSSGAWECVGILEDAQGRTIRACEWCVLAWSAVQIHIIAGLMRVLDAMTGRLTVATWPP
jgi:WD40 repeat protein